MKADSATSSSPVRVLLLAVMLVISGVLVACGGESADPGGGEAIEHVHGLGINPADGALFIATHSGLFRSPEGSTVADRVGESAQDTMGFTVVGADRFLGSGHPGPGEGGPASLGLIESDDAGSNWRGISLAGEADFHVLRYAHQRIYAVNALTGLLMVSSDEGKTWAERQPPGPVIDLAVDPDDRKRLIVSTERGLAISEDDGESWRPLLDEVGLITWTESGRLYLVDAAGQVQSSDDVGQAWAELGSIGGQPGALVSATDEELYAALVDGTVMASTDGGVSWKVRSSQ
jgi:photosystem II stability/assembly factor-like uncharacterized protein